MSDETNLPPGVELPPPPVRLREGCRCADCGFRYRVDVLLPDALWNRIARKNEELLCGVCLLSRIEDMGEVGAFRLEEVP